MTTAAAKSPAPPAAAPASTSTALAKNEPPVFQAQIVQIGEVGIELRSLDDLVAFAERLYKENALPKGMNVGSAVIAIQAGLQCGLGLMGGLQYGKVINGRFGWMGEGVQAILDNSPKVKPGSFDFWLEGQGEETKAVATAWRVGYDTAFTSEFTLKDARTAELYPAKDSTSPWKKYPKRMLKWRAVGFLGKDRFADLLGGFPLADELRDHPEMTARVISPPSERPALPAPVDDPLSAFIAGRKPEAIIEAELVREPSPEVEKQEVLASEPEREPGGEDDEADDRLAVLAAERELAEREQKQRRLFEGR
jgi:hypothetical protein